MVVIVRFDVSPSGFELSELLPLGSETTVAMETLVLGAKQSIPIVWIAGPGRDATIEHVREELSADAITELEATEDRTLIALDWDIDSDPLVRAIGDSEGFVLRVTGTAEKWTFVVRFRKHEGPAQFQQRCRELGIRFDVVKIYYSTDPAAAVTVAQREALTLAVARGYYAVPRRCTTTDLAEALDISAQSVTERLRRGVSNLVTSTLIERTEPP